MKELLLCVTRVTTETGYMVVEVPSDLDDDKIGEVCTTIAGDYAYSCDCIDFDYENGDIGSVTFEKATNNDKVRYHTIGIEEFEQYL